MREGAVAELSGFEQLTLPLRTPRQPQPHTLCNCAVAWGGDQLRGFAIASEGAGRSCGASRHRGKPGRPSTPCSNSKKLRESGRGFLIASQAGVVFPAPMVRTAIQKQALTL